jgi:hypothetical protein
MPTTVLTIPIVTPEGKSIAVPVHPLTCAIVTTRIDVTKDVPDTSSPFAVMQVVPKEGEQTMTAVMRRVRAFAGSSDITELPGHGCFSRRRARGRFASAVANGGILYLFKRNVHLIALANGGVPIVEGPDIERAKSGIAAAADARTRVAYKSAQFQLAYSYELIYPLMSAPKGEGRASWTEGIVGLEVPPDAQLRSLLSANTFAAAGTQLREFLARQAPASVPLFDAALAKEAPPKPAT